MSAPLFEFTFWFAEADSKGFVYARFDLDTRITVIAATQDEASSKATTMLSAPRTGRHWAPMVVSAREIQPAAGDTP